MIERPDPRLDRPCRRCRHYDCMMDRGEPLPEHVTAYINGALYLPEDRPPPTGDVGGDEGGR